MTYELSANYLLHKARTSVRNIRWRKPILPQLRVTSISRLHGTAWIIAPDWNRPSGGIRKLYRTVDVLNGAGIQAAIVHHAKNFRCDWFSHQTKIVAAGDVVVSPSDVLVVPEIYASSISTLPRDVRQIILNQNAYVTLDSLIIATKNAANPYLLNPGLIAVVAVSDQNAELLRYAFQSIAVHRVHWALDPAIYFPPLVAPARRIAFMPRRRANDAAQVMALLRLRQALVGWEIVEIDGCSECETAEILRSCRIFLSFSEREGLGLPPLEAIACGCLVVGFTGYAGREFFQSPFAISIEDGDVGAFAAAIEQVVAWTDAEPEAALRAAREGSRYALQKYSLQIERNDLLSLFRPLLA